MNNHIEYPNVAVDLEKVSLGPQVYCFFLLQ